MNGEAMKVNGETYQIGTMKQIAGRQHMVYNTMPGLSLIGFVRIGKNGQPTKEVISLSTAQIDSLTKVGTIQ